MSPTLPGPVHAYLRRFVLRRRGWAVLKATAHAITLGVAWTLFACLLDRFLQLPPALRLALLILGIAAIIPVLGRPLFYLLFGRIDWLRAAAALEDTNPVFAGRLHTVVSQLMERPEYRGSTQMLDQLLQEVTEHAQLEPLRQPIRSHSLLRPWCAATSMLLILLSLCLLPWLDMPTLLLRFAFPQAPIAPVTTTRIFAEPGDISLLRGSPLDIRARVERLQGSIVEIFTSPDASSWSRIPMLRMPDGHYSFNLSTLERDLYYYIRAGDAKTHVCKVSILQAPAVAQYRLRYEYPDYTQRSPLDAVSHDGLIEALVGTTVHLSLLSTEPLRSATLSIGRQQLPLNPTSDPNLWQAQLTIQQNQSADLEMISTGGLTAKIPNALSLRAQPDRPPLLRLLQPTGDLRLAPRALTSVHYQAMDDYGITRLSLVLQVNSSPVRTIPLQRHGDPRRIEGQLALDLATLSLAVGDVVTFNLVAQDGPGHAVSSDTCHILISPRSIDINTHLRIAELRQASQLAATVLHELQQADDLLEAAIRTDGVGSEYITVRIKASGRLAGALEASLLLHQSLLRACAKCASSDQTTALALAVDLTRIQSTACERLTTADTRGESERALVTQLKRLIPAAEQLALRIKTLSEGEQAAAILADLANLRTPPTSQPADPLAAQRLQETLRRAQEENRWALQALGLDPNATNLERVLQHKAHAASQLIRSSSPIDFAHAADQWLAAVRQGNASATPLPERLASASSVEAVRTDADPIIARDLQLASRAAARLAQAQADENPSAAQLLREIAPEFTATLATLQREHRLRRLPLTAVPPDQIETIRKSAAEARQRLALWAATPAPDLASNIASSLTPEELALHASAKTAERDYASAEAIDRQFLAHVAAEADSSAAEQLKQAITRVRRIDDVSVEQQAIIRQTSELQLADSREAQRLSIQQQQVAQRISSIDETDVRRARLAANADSRRQATAAIHQVQEELARMPQQLTSALLAADVYRQAVANADEAYRAVGKADSENWAIAQRNADQARRAVWDAEEELIEVASALSSETADQFANTLRSYRPETDNAISAIAAQLQPALQELHHAMHAADKSAVDRAAARVRAAIETTQLRLREAQARIIESDPLVAARWFAEAAAQSLAQYPPDVPKARGHQQTVSMALGRAWQGAVRDVASVRLSLTPGFRSLIGTQSPPASLAQSVGSLIEMLPGLHQWGFLRPRHADNLNAPLRESEPSTYQDALRVYFEYLGKSQHSAK